MGALGRSKGRVSTTDMRNVSIVTVGESKVELNYRRYEWVERCDPNQHKGLDGSRKSRLSNTSIIG